MKGPTISRYLRIYRACAVVSLSAAAMLIGIEQPFARNAPAPPYADSGRAGDFAPWRPTGLPSAPVATSRLPKRQMSVHNQGNIQMSLINNGAFGYATYYWADVTKDPFSADRIATVHYPRDSDVRFQMNGTLLLGAIVGRDTLVSTGVAEFYPEAGGLGDFRYRSMDVNHPAFDPEANSQLDIICEYLDTFHVYAQYDIRPHLPLGVKITQKSMAWTGDNIDDFILFDFQIDNIGRNHLRELYVGFIAHGGVNYVGDFDYTLKWYDDVVGFLPTFPAPEGCRFVDTLNIAYQMDADGDPIGQTWPYYATKGVVGMRILGIPSENWRVNFNWSSMLGFFAGTAFSPRRLGTIDWPFRSNLPHLTQAIKDAELYYYLAKPEIDYHQLWTGQNQSAGGWIAPPPDAFNYAVKSIPYYLISAGPFEMRPGARESVALAVIGGTDVHVNPQDFAALYRLYDPLPFYRSLDFSNLAVNARWAGWIYDNPGIDTDSDGYAGEFRICEGKTDTFWYTGDGVPDFRADGPPQTPKLRVIPSEGQLTIRWNGYYAETQKDPFTNIVDFEGYRVYVGLDDRLSSLTLLSVYDRENYDRFHWEEQPDTTFRWVSDDIPFTIDSLRKIYNDPEFDPRFYTRLNPLEVKDTLYYFAAHGYNAFSLCCLDNIHKLYANATDPGTDPSLWTEDDVTYDYGEPLPKYYEYEYVHDRLLTSIPYWIAVTAFDFGFAGGKIPSKESSPLNNMVMELAQTPVDTVERYELDAFVYPNPWRWDGRYSEFGYENRDGTEVPARSRRIHFTNLPRVCKISIYSLDGDLVRVLRHNFPEGGPASMHDTWDMISRNAQLVESGIYYYVIESEIRTQMGKLVIIK